MTDREKGDSSDTFDPFAAPMPPQQPPQQQPPPWPPSEPGPTAAPPNPVPAPWDRAARPGPAAPPPAPEPQAEPDPSADPAGPLAPTDTGAQRITPPEHTGPHTGSQRITAPETTGPHTGSQPIIAPAGPSGDPYPERTEPYDRRTAYGPPPVRDDGPAPYGTAPGPGAPRPGYSRGPQRPNERAGPPPYPGPPTAQWTNEPPRQGELDRRAGGGQPAGQAPGNPADWNYDRIRSSELVRARKIPPSRGWRRFVLRASLGVINLGPSADERRQAELEAKIRSLLRGRYKIGVLGKGGTGKTTIAAAVGSILAELRQEDRVVAIDADTAFGKLGSRVDPSVSGSYWELAADQHLQTFADVRSRVGSNTSGLFVLPGERSAARRRVLDPAIYREATARLDNHFTISIVDCGSTMDAPVTREALQDLDALVVLSSPWVDGASAAAQTLEWLAHNGYTGLLHRTVVVLNDADGHSNKHNLKTLAEEFGNLGQVVIELPYDRHLRPGGVIDVDNELEPLTRRRVVEIAAAIAEHFPTTTDRPKERR